MKGSYLLLMLLPKEERITIGQQGELLFPKGYYVYVGSALHGLEQRIHRHLKKEKKLYWHIDYFLQKASIVDVFYKESIVRQECEIAHHFASYVPSIPSFGCSDCSCLSHLFTGPYEQIQQRIEELHIQRHVPHNKS